MRNLVRRESARRALVATGAALTGIATAAAGLALATPASAATSGHWRISYEYRASQSMFDSLAVPGKNDAWAVGTLSTSARGNLFKPFVVHWNGRKWRRVGIPGARGYMMGSVAASSARDVWVFASKRNDARTTIFRWNGSWSRIQTPAGYTIGYADVLSPRNAWSIVGVGCTSPTGGVTHCTTDIEHWNGKRWIHLTAPGIVTDLSGTRRTGIYDVGTNGRGRLVAHHWARGHWAPLHMAHPKVKDSLGIHVTSARNIWVSVNLRGNRDYALHWNGRRWRRTPAVTARLDHRAGGYDIVPDNHGGVWLSTSHWTGRAWINTWRTNPPDRRTAPSGAVVSGFAKVPGTARSYWAVGRRYGCCSAHAIIVRYGPRP